MDVFSIVSLLLALAGLGLALMQLDRTSTAVEAAEAAAKRAERDSTMRQILVLMPTLEQSEQALDAAVVAGQHAVARRELAIWRVRASELKGLLSQRKDVDPSVKQDLDASITQAAAAKNRLFDESVDLVATTDRARKQLSDAVEALTELSGRLKANAGEEIADG